MKIVQIVPEMEVGGVEQGTYDLARGLLEKGHQSIIISHGGRLISGLKALGVKHYLLPVHRKSPLIMARMVKKVRKILQEENIEILHARSRVPAWLGYYACRNLKRVHFITSFHGFYSPHPLSRIMAKGERVIGVSNSVAQYARDKFKVAEEKLRVVYNGVAIKKYPKLKKGNYRIGILGRITPLKGQIYFIKAFTKVKEKFPQAQGFIIGPVSKDKIRYQKQLENLIEDLHLKNIGFISPEQKDEIFPTLDILVSASIVPESFGRTMVEAQLAGILAIATDIGGSREIIENGKTGFLVPPKNPDALAEAIIRSFTHQEECQKMIEVAKKIAQEKFSIEQMVNATINIYQELVTTN